VRHHPENTTRNEAIADLMALLDAGPSPFHVVGEMTRRLDDTGWQRLALDHRWSADDVHGRRYVVRDGAVIAWNCPDGAPAHTPWRIVGAHTDSPCLRVKPSPDISRHGWRQIAIEIYGGVLLNSWLDRDLGIAGRVVRADGSTVLVDSTTALCRVPQLAIHLDRSVNDGLRLDRQTHMTPVLGTDNDSALTEWIADAAGGDATTWDLCLYDVTPAALIGTDRSLLASGRLDNQLSCWAGVRALIAAQPSNAIAVVVANDHEEVGSASVTGAAGPLLEQVLSRHVHARGGDIDDRHRSYATSLCVSADNAHALHPNYPERHDPGHAPRIGAGPAVKVNVNQRYATDASSAAAFIAACTTAGVPHQTFSSNNEMPCGSTIGPITATRLGIDTVDVGVPQLSMHSARELCGVDDPVALASALTVHLSA
jgi:aspartyl aminopeptidase